MRGRPTELLVYEQMFPRPKGSEPRTFQHLSQDCLIPEIRSETHAFFGHLETEEARYPGLDYNDTTHRMRLSRWPWHNRLFKAFDALSLTKSEVNGLTKWEGTKWAKDKYELEQGRKIRDTTADGIPDWVEPDEEPLDAAIIQTGTVPTSQVHVVTSPAPAVRSEQAEDEEKEGERDLLVEEHDFGAIQIGAGPEEGLDQESDEEIIESVGIELNQRLRDRVARLEAGETSVVMDEEWDQWFKNAMESGDFASFTEQMTEEMLRSSNITSTGIPLGLIPPSMLASARAGQWSEIPELLRPLLRRTLEADDNSRRMSSTNNTSNNATAHRQNFRNGGSEHSSWPLWYSNLRLAIEGNGVNVNRGVSPPGA